MSRVNFNETPFYLIKVVNNETENILGIFSSMEKGIVAIISYFSALYLYGRRQKRRMNRVIKNNHNDSTSSKETFH